MGNGLRFGALALAAVIVFASGFWLARAGRPYVTPLLTVHKLVSLAGIVFVGVLVFQAARNGAYTQLDWFIVVAVLVAAVAVFATGGVASAISDTPVWVLVVHRVVPWPLVALVGLTAYRLAGRS